MSHYQKIQQKLARGWNTWNTRSVLSHVLLPEGFALNLAFKEYREGNYLKEALIGRRQDIPLDSWRDNRVEEIHPGGHAYDGSYTELNLKWHGLEVVVQSATDGNDLVLLVIPCANQKRPAALVVESGILWNHEGGLRREKERMVGVFASGEIAVYTTKPHTDDPNIAVQTPYIAMVLDGPTGVSTGKERGLEEIRAIITRNKQAHEARKARFGDLAECYNAMQTCFAWDTIYEPLKKRVVTPVSWVWNVHDWGGYILHCWDVYFGAYIASLDSKELAYANCIEITREKTPEGFVPNCAAATGYTSFDRSQPPVGSMVVREIYRKYREEWFLEELFPDLYAWNTWYLENREVEQGVMAWGSKPFIPLVDNPWETAGVNDTFGGALESGLDNSPMYDGIPFNRAKNRMELMDVGLTGLYAMDCRALADIAGVLGRKKEEEILRSRAARCSKGLQELWDDTTGMFLNKRTDTGEFSPRISPTNFYALFGESIQRQQLERMMKEHLYNPSEFWGEWMMPSIARNDPAYADQEYWRGRIWAPMNFLVYLGLRQQHLVQAHQDLAEKSRRLLLKEWLEKGHVHENYHGDTGEGCDSNHSDKFYHWGGLLGLIALIEAGFVDGPEQKL